MLAGTFSFGRGVPAGLVEQDHGMCAGRDGLRDLLQMQGHGGAVAPRQHEPGAVPRSGQMAPKMYVDAVR